MAHTLKGVAGNLGATAVQARAEVLESALRRGDSAVEVDSALDQVAKAVDALFDALKATDGFKHTEVALPAQSLTPEDRKAALHITQQIKLLLANDDPQAQELWETHAALLQAVCAHASAVQAAINAFAFDEALQWLNAPNGPEGA
jgi:two-component system sensor histidine kinase/response regulator